MDPFDERVVRSTSTIPLRLLEGLPFLSLPVRLLRVLFDASVFPTKHGHRHDSGFGLAADLVYFHCGGLGAAAPVEEGKVGQEGGLFKRARTPPQNITADG